MHEEIKKFHLEGVFGGSANQVQFKQGVEHWLETDMREHGYVPVLDMDTQYSRQYDVEKDEFKFQLSIYGTYVGRDEAWGISGVMNGKRIPKYTHQAKSKAS